jgi:8-oxo-dGTP diphosphatase
VSCAVAVVVTHRQRVLFGKRVSAEDGFEWQLPGGWIEVGEPPQQAARREVLEETGLVLGELVFVGVTSNVFSEHKHSISLYFEAPCLRAESLQIREGDKCTSWEWKRWPEVSRDLYLPLRLLKNTDYQPFLGARRQTYVSI